MKVVYLPGILGSNMSVEGYAGFPQQKVWCDLDAIYAGGLAWLDLAEDGINPGPLAGGRVIVTDGIYSHAYGPLYLYLRYQGYDVLAAEYDWRLSVITTAARLWPVIQEWADGQPIYFVCHSLGGLVARAIYAQMVSAGQDDQCARMLTLCTPHYGCLEAVRLWLRLPYLYSGLVRTASFGHWLQGYPGPDYLDQMIASHPSWYELMAWAGEGPLYQQSPAQAAEIFTPALYVGANPYVSASLLQDAEVTQTTLSTAIPAGRLVCVAGVGVQTPYIWQADKPPGRDTSWLYQSQGDGLVTLEQAAPAGVPVGTVRGSHGIIPLMPSVWAAIPGLLTGPMPAVALLQSRLDGRIA